MLELYDSIGRWGLFWAGVENVHPDDRQRWQGVRGYVFYCRAITKESYLIIDYGDYRLRVQPRNYHVVPPLDFYLGDFVTIKKYPEKTAQIREVLWHFNRGEPVFWLWVNGKKKSRRYFRDELARKGWG